MFVISSHSIVKSLDEMMVFIASQKSCSSSTSVDKLICLEHVFAEMASSNVKFTNIFPDIIGEPVANWTNDCNSTKNSSLVITWP